MKNCNVHLMILSSLMRCFSNNMHDPSHRKSQQLFSFASSVPIEPATMMPNLQNVPLSPPHRQLWAHRTPAHYCIINPAHIVYQSFAYEVLPLFLPPPTHQRMCLHTELHQGEHRTIRHTLKIMLNIADG